MAVMSDASDKLSERDEIEALLPWYVSGRLDVQSRARVERYMKAHPEMRDHLAFAREEADATVTANEVIAAPGPEALARLRASIAVAPRRQSIFARFSERFADWIGGFTPPQLGLAAALAALLIVAQAAAISGLVMERVATPAYETAGGGEEAGQGVELLVAFSETASIGEISDLLKRVGAVVVDGPKAGLYRLRLPGTGEEGREAAIETLQKSGVVKSVLPGQ
jgi:anti-sigma-K factor RskA